MEAHAGPPLRSSAASSEHSIPAFKKDIELELTDVQRGNIRDMNGGLGQTRWRKWLTWFPRVPSAHAAIAAPRFITRKPAGLHQR